jgi:hypothetical protein
MFHLLNYFMNFYETWYERCALRLSGTNWYILEYSTCFTDPVAARSEVRALSARAMDRGLESRLRHGCLSSSFYVVLSCVGRGLATG